MNGWVSIPLVSIPVHWNGRRWNGLNWIPIHWSPIQGSRHHRVGLATVPAERTKRVPGRFHYNAGNEPDHRRWAPCPNALPAAPSWSRPSHTPHRLHEEALPHGRTGLLPPSHRRRRGGRRRHHRNQAQRQSGGGRFPGVILAQRNCAPRDGAVRAITRRQPRASRAVLRIKTVETRSRPTPARLAWERIAVHGGKSAVPQPGDAIEQQVKTSRAKPRGGICRRARCNPPSSWSPRPDGSLGPMGTILVAVILGPRVRRGSMGRHLTFTGYRRMANPDGKRPEACSRSAALIPGNAIIPSGAQRSF